MTAIMTEHLPAFGICGWSGSGKTTVIEEAIRRLTGRGLRVAVIKHDVHGLNIDHEGKDSDKFFKAGADVLMRGPKQNFLRAHRTADSSLLEVLKLISPYYDITLVEGHKSTPLFNKVWVLKDDNDECPPEAVNVKRVLGRDENRVSIVMEMIDSMLPETWIATPVYAGILIGMDKAKHLISDHGKTWIERTVEVVRPCVDEVVVLGQGEIPRDLLELHVLPDIPDVKGPLAGMLSAMRWQPLASWLFIACDLPMISSEAVKWLLSTRAPGVWATIPRLEETDTTLRSSDASSPRSTRNVAPFPAHYDFRSHHLLEESSGPADIATSKKVITPNPPSGISDVWTSINIPADNDRP